MVFGECGRQDGCVCTLRTQNEMLWILMVDCAGVVTLSRCLHPVERLGLQGFSPELAKGLSKRALLRFTVACLLGEAAIISGVNKSVEHH